MKPWQDSYQERQEYVRLARSCQEFKRKTDKRE